MTVILYAESMEVKVSMMVKPRGSPRGCTLLRPQRDCCDVEKHRLNIWVDYMQTVNKEGCDESICRQAD